MNRIVIKRALNSVHDTNPSTLTDDELYAAVEDVPDLISALSSTEIPEYEVAVNQLNRDLDVLRDWARARGLLD